MSMATTDSLTQRLESLAPLLTDIAEWHRQPHLYPVDAAIAPAIETSISDLETRIRQFRADPSLLTVVLMGGTGVGKSTTLNALAGAKIADAGIARPTTQFPTIYHHADVAIERLDPIFAKCRKSTHHRPELRYKILVDTPDIDGNVREHRERLREMLPAADAILYVGSQEKYHDQFAWQLLLEQKGNRAFAFILNKWDRCLNSRHESTGQSPDADLRQSLISAGFEAPVIFRTCSSQWYQRRIAVADGASHESDPGLIEDDFRQLEAWLEDGLTERAIRDIKSRGVSGKLDEVCQWLDKEVAPDWTLKVRPLRREWEQALREAVADHARLLVEAADPHSAAFERHFSQLGRGDFRGLFGMYLTVLERLWKFNITMMPSTKAGENPKIKDLANRCVAEIPRSTRHSYKESLHSHLLAIADKQEWPVETLETFLPAERTGVLSDTQLSEILVSQLNELETQFAEPTGGKYATRLLVKGLCDWLPQAVVLIITLKWLYDGLFDSFWGINAYFGAVTLLALTLGGLHVLLARTVPSQWEILRSRLQRMVENQLLDRIAPAYYEAIDKFDALIQRERQKVQQFLTSLSSIRDSLRRSSRGGEQGSLFAKTPPARQRAG